LRLYVLHSKILLLLHHTSGGLKQWLATIGLEGLR
jgi:hypothetical protein